jgi:PAS domain-containing protein
MDTSAHGPEWSWPGFELQRIVDSTPALIHTARPDGYHDFFNKTCLNYVGCSLEDLQGMKWTASIHSEDVEGMVNAWRTSLASGDPFLYEARVRRASWLTGIKGSSL